MWAVLELYLDSGVLRIRWCWTLSTYLYRDRIIEARGSVINFGEGNDGRIQPDDDSGQHGDHLPTTKDKWQL